MIDLILCEEMEVHNLPYMYNLLWRPMQTEGLKIHLALAVDML
jgi:hypothetical protein